MSGSGEYTVSPVDWNSPEGEEARRIRFAVFVDEQRVPAEEELDDIDLEALHVVAYDRAGSAAGTARLFEDRDSPQTCRIGRMAVLPEHRKSGCGSALLKVLLAEGKVRGYRQAVLSAQAHAMLFYEKHGFKIAGDLYEDAGIPHFPMMRDL